MLNKVNIKNRVTYITISRGALTVKNYGFVFSTEDKEILIPVATILMIFIEPGVTISHRAVELAAKLGTSLIFISEGGTRLYSLGTIWNKNNSNTIKQAKAAFTLKDRKKILNKMFFIRFGENPPRKNLTEDQLRGIEGARVRSTYQYLAKKYNVEWKGRAYEKKSDNKFINDKVNQALTSSNFALYSIVEAVIVALGYSPAIGFLHSGKNISFVLDIADLIKFETTVPLSFRLSKSIKNKNLNKEVRLACRDMFNEKNIISKIIELIEEVFEVLD